MREITSMNRLQNQNQTSGTAGNRAGTRRQYASIALGIAGGALCAVAGFLLLAIHSLTGGYDRLENYGGGALLVSAFICFGVSAHFMDEADDAKRQYKKERFERFKKDNSAE